MERYKEFEKLQERFKRFSIEADILDGNVSSWEKFVDLLRLNLGAPGNSELFPPHFLKKTFKNIGGHICVLGSNSETMGALFLFPQPNESYKAFLNLSPNNNLVAHRENILLALSENTPGVNLFYPSNATSFEGEYIKWGELEIGHPSKGEP